jgi:nucleoid-associated protein EbfC
MNPMDVFNNLKNMQSRVKEMQDKLNEVSVTGSAGGDLVRVTMNGHMQVTGVEISKDVVDPNDVEMLQDLMLAACSDASAKVREKLQTELSGLTGGMGFPPGFMDPGANA